MPCLIPASLGSEVGAVHSDTRLSRLVGEAAEYLGRALSPGAVTRVNVNTGAGTGPVVTGVTGV